MSRVATRERQVLDGLVTRLSNKAIASDNGLSAQAVDAYRANMRKMRVGNLSDLVRFAGTSWRFNLKGCTAKSILIVSAPFDVGIFKPGSSPASHTLHVLDMKMNQTRYVRGDDPAQVRDHPVFIYLS
jgi:DNA-binding CsgD family transcriptional regulator